ncbi:hypothetical protein ADK41_06240 [Streptomyces caelestis]|uniref:Uncharacterized protein n=1 Tax=Streptomyces caelestis TaxID=36816 RepID=A0A0M8QMD2_9ACTN|nr:MULTISPECIES: hypothetical protein [Streptomyces]KOT43078.1 hypothetical protein ADK41_06240 [Streptomyces caelestis]
MAQRVVAEEPHHTLRPAVRADGTHEEARRADDGTYRVEIKGGPGAHHPRHGLAERVASGARTAREAAMPFRAAAVGC